MLDGVHAGHDWLIVLRIEGGRGGNGDSMEEPQQLCYSMWRLPFLWQDIPLAGWS